MHFINNISEEKYENFVKNNVKSHFMQSYYFGNIMEYKHFSKNYVGIEKDGEIIATALLLKKKLLGKYCYYYCPRGFILDYKNKELIKIFTDFLLKYSKKNKGIFIKIDPDIKLHDLDQDGNILGNENVDLVNYLISLGYKHKGFNTEFVNEQPRFTFRLNLKQDMDMLYSNIHPTTRKILNKGNQYNLNVYKGNVNDIPKFYETMIDTASREGLLLTSIDYYKNFYTILNNKNMSDLYVVEVNIDDLLNTYQNKLDNLLNDLNALEDPKYKNKDKSINIKNDLTKQIEKMKIETENIKKIDKKTIVLSSIITVKYGNKVWTIHGGNANILRELNANYLLYYTIIQDAHKDNYEIIDFFGTSGLANPSPDNPIFGIHSFKKRFGGEYTEFIGEFDLITNKIMYFLYKKLLPIYRKIK